MIYRNLNKAIEYIEENLENEIEYNKISKILGTNEYTMQKIFSVLCDVTLTDYIRKRRLSNAGQDIYIGKDKIIDIAIKYQYNNPTAFSRAFEKFHGIKPSQVKKNPQGLKVYTKLVFDENIEFNKKLNYSIIQKEKMVLYGKIVKTSINKIKKDAPLFFEEMEQKNGKPNYGMTVYKDELRKLPIEYWTLYEKQIEGGIEYIIPPSKWLQFIIKSQDAKHIQETVDSFYKGFFSSCKYNLRDLGELEYYHDEITEFLIPIEN